MKILDKVESEDDMPQKEVLKLLKISGAKIKTLRENHMTTDDWYRDAVCLQMPQNERSKHIWARVRQLSGEWERHPILVTPRIRAFLSPGKPFKVQLVETEDGDKSYRHESLCP